MSYLVILATVILSPLSVSCHSNIVWPYTWFDKGGVLGMTPGTQCAGGGDTGIGPCMWFSNYTFISGVAMLGRNPSLPNDICCLGANTAGLYENLPGSEHWRLPIRLYQGKLVELVPGGDD